jgi:ribosomal protein L19E
MSQKEREKNRKLREELKNRRENGEVDLVIFKGSIVKRKDDAFRGTNRTRDPGGAPTPETA